MILAGGRRQKAGGRCELCFTDLNSAIADYLVDSKSFFSSYCDRDLNS